MPSMTSAELLAYLGRLGLETETVEHPPLHTVEESQALRGEIPGAHTKNLFVKDKKDNVFLITAKEDTPVNLKHIHQHVEGSGRVSFCKPDLMMELLGVTPGSVTVFGLMNDTGRRVRFVLDEALSAHELVNAHPLVNTATTTLAYADLLTFVRATGHEPRVLPLANL